MFSTKIWSQLTQVNASLSDASHRNHAVSCRRGSNKINNLPKL